MFLRKTALANDEYQRNFTIIDNDILAAIASDEALAISRCIPTIYLRLRRAPTELWEREGVLRLVGEDHLTAWQQLASLTGVANTTLSKSIAWLREKGIIGYVAHKNGVGIRIFFNRAISSIGTRKKNIPISPTPLPQSPAPPNRAPFKEDLFKRDLDNTNTSAPPRETIAPPPQLGNQFLADFKKEIVALLKRESQATRDWFMNFGIPKATRVSTREAFNVLGQKKTVSADVGRSQPVIESKQEIGKEVAEYLGEVACHYPGLKDILESAAKDVESLLGLQGVESIAERLDQVEERVAAALRMEASVAWLSEAETAIRRQYAARNWEPHILEQTVAEGIKKKLFEEYRLPRLGYFYLC